MRCAHHRRQCRLSFHPCAHMHVAAEPKPAGGAIGAVVEAEQLHVLFALLHRLLAQQRALVPARAPLAAGGPLDESHPHTAWFPACKRSSKRRLRLQDPHCGLAKAGEEQAREVAAAGGKEECGYLGPLLAAVQRTSPHCQNREKRREPCSAPRPSPRTAVLSASAHPRRNPSADQQRARRRASSASVGVHKTLRQPLCGSATPRRCARAR